MNGMALESRSEQEQVPKRAGVGGGGRAELESELLGADGRTMVTLRRRQSTQVISTRSQHSPVPPSLNRKQGEKNPNVSFSGGICDEAGRGRGTLGDF